MRVHRHRRPRRPRQVVARAGPHRHRSRPVRRGEAARPDDRPRVRPRRRSTVRPSASWTCPATCGSCATCSPASAASTPACSSSPRPRVGSRRARSTCGSSSSSASATASIALTKVDVLDDPELVELAALEVAEHVAGTFLADAPIVPVAAPVGARCRRAARRRSAALARTTPAATDRGRARLWIDRVFAAKGSGTVVTGTLTDGSVAIGDQLVVEPGGQVVRVRPDPDARRARRRRSGPGNRVALNLAGVEHHDADARRRDRRAPAGGARRTASTPRSRCSPRSTTSCRGAARTSPTSARASTPCGSACSARSRSGPGAGGLVRLHLDDGAAAAARRPLRAARDRARRDGRRRRGARHRRPSLPASRARPDRSRRPGRRRAGLGRRRRARAAHGRTAAADRRSLGGDARWRWRRRPTRSATGWTAGPVALSSLDERERAVLDGLDDVVIDATSARLVGGDRPARRPPGDRRARRRRRWRRRRRPASTGPACASSPAAACSSSATASGGTRRPSTDRRRRSPPACCGTTRRASPSETFREAAGITRKHAVPLLAELDARGVTRRRGDLRIAGNRLPSLPG